VSFSFSVSFSWSPFAAAAVVLPDRERARWPLFAWPPAFFTENWRITSEVWRFRLLAPCVGGVSKVDAVEAGAGPAASGVSQKM